MAFIPVNLNDAVESQPVPNGRYSLTITACEETKTKELGKPQYRVSIGFDEQPTAPNLTHFVGLPTESDEPNKMQFKMLLLKRFLALFDIPYDSKGIDTEKLAMEMVGRKCTAEVVLGEPNANGNVYNGLVVPRLKGEGVQVKSAPKPPKR